MNTEKAIRKYMDTIRSDTFSRYEKEFAHKMVSSLSEDYLKLKREEDVVQSVENVVNELNKLTVKDTSMHFEIKTSALFIHGNKSLVGFDYYGENVERELGDLIFICSLVFNNKKYFQKLTINQFKKNDSSKKSTSWDLSNREQLYLLSRFPKFRGVNRGSLIPTREFTLPNKSGCLGSYGLLYKPGDFAFISATELEGFVGSRKSLKESDFYDLTQKIERFHFGLYPLLHLDPDYYEFLEHCSRRCFDWPLPWNYFGKHHYAHNVFDFAHKYLTMGIGEPIFMERGYHNSQARHLIHALLSGVEGKAKKAPDSLESKGMVAFVEEFHKFGYVHGNDDGKNDNMPSDFDGGGIGIMHTTINLGE